MEIENVEGLLEIPQEHIPSAINFIRATVDGTKPYVQLVKSGVANKVRLKHVIYGDPLSYDSTKAAIETLAKRNDLTPDQKSQLEEMASFWSAEEQIIRKGFYGK